MRSSCLRSVSVLVSWGVAACSSPRAEGDAVIAVGEGDVGAPLGQVAQALQRGHGSEESSPAPGRSRPSRERGRSGRKGEHRSRACKPIELEVEADRRHRRSVIELGESRSFSVPGSLQVTLGSARSARAELTFASDDTSRTCIYGPARRRSSKLDLDHCTGGLVAGDTLSASSLELELEARRSRSRLRVQAVVEPAAPCDDACDPERVDDDNPCTDDSCGADGERHDPVAAGTSCSDSNACNGQESCSADGQCMPGLAPVVDDDNPCTEDACDPATGVSHEPAAAGSTCGNADPCDGIEACDDSGACVDTGEPAPPECAPVEATLEAPPATVFSTALVDIGLPASLTLAAPTAGLEAGFPELRVEGGSIVIATPGDTGTEQRFVLEFVAADGTPATLTLVVSSARPLSVFAVSESDGEGESPAEPPALEVAGLGPGNQLTAGTLSLRVAAGASPSPAFSRLSVANAAGIGVDVTHLSVFDATSGTFSLDVSALRGAIGGLVGELEFTANLISADYEFAQVYAFPLLVPTTRLLGQLVDAQGAPVATAGIDELEIAVVGLSSDLRRVVPVAADGSFVVDDLLSETYRLVITDLAQPNVFTGFAAITPGVTEASIQLLYDPGIIAPAVSPVDGVRAREPRGVPIAGAWGRALVGSRTLERASSPPDATARPPSRSVPSVIDPSITGCPTTGANGDTFFVVNGSTQGVDQLCALSYSAPEGTAEVLIEVEVSTAEFPTFTQQQSQFNDTWSYSVNAANTAQPASLTASGKVNDTHVVSGRISQRTCVKARTDAEGNILTQPPISLSGSLVTQNVGDSALATRVAVRVSDSCGELLIRKAELRSPNAAGRAVIEPVVVSPTNGNRAGRFISLPTTTPDGLEFGLPLRVEYAPADAELTEVTLGIVRGGVLAKTPNLLTSGVVAANGTIDFSNLVLPPLAGLPIDSRAVGLSVQLVGQIDGTDAQTEEGDVNVLFKGQNTFTPLFLAEDTIPAASRRYGQGAAEPGDDDWALSSTIEYLQSVQFRFNDVSAQHVAQTAAGRSVLNHNGHSDGSQIDLRYLTPNGQFDDGGTEAVNLALVDNAVAECVAALSDPATPSTSREALINWVLFNRAAIEVEAPRGRKIYVANGRIGLALVEGLYPFVGPTGPGAPPPPCGDQITLPLPPGQEGPPPTLSTWLTRPANVSIQAEHLNHWHIALR